jgi:hypothetical protein
MALISTNWLFVSLAPQFFRLEEFVDFSYLLGYWSCSWIDLANDMFQLNPVLVRSEFMFDLRYEDKRFYLRLISKCALMTCHAVICLVSKTCHHKLM